eukprot:40728-Eustigmatos_ZCMA.PRE.1
MALPDMLRGARGEGSGAERVGAIPDATQAAAFLQQLAGNQKSSVTRLGGWYCIVHEALRHSCI